MKFQKYFNHINLSFIIVIGYLFLASTRVMPQTSGETSDETVSTPPEKTLLSTPIVHGAYAAPVLKFSQVGAPKEGSLIVGAQGGWVINHQWVVGLGIYGLSTAIKAPEIREIAGLIMTFNYGGLFLSYIHHSHKMIHWEITAVGGVGELNYRDEEYWAKYENGDNFAVVEVGVNGVLNLTPGFRLA
ncbi:MAG: hypothetical protein EHM72_13125, partial [Calditrichaeota bacterium]